MTVRVTATAAGLEQRLGDDRHNVSVMVVQASAGEEVFYEDPDKARESLSSVASTGRAALAELRRLLGVIRSEDDGGGEPPATDTRSRPGCRSRSARRKHPRAGLRRPGARARRVPGDPRRRILVLTTFDLDEYAHAALPGASGFLLKDVTPAQLLEAIRIVAAGDALLAPSVMRRLLARFAATLPVGDHSSEALAQLTSRETEVLRLLAGGLSNAEIASELVVSEATVKTHISSVLRRLGLRDRVQAVILVYETGLVKLGSA